MLQTRWINPTLARVAPWLLVVLLCAGCGRVGQVAGKVTYRDKPVPDGTVMLVASDGRPYDGKIQEDGSFLIRDVPAGTAKVSVTSMATSDTASSGDKGDARAKQRNISKGGARSRIPLKYSDFNQSGLTVTVEKGATAELKLDLK